MADELKGSPYRRHRDDMESGTATCSSKDEDEDEDGDPFDISRTKNVAIDRLKRWRQSALVLNANRRFRYTMDLKKDEEKQLVLSKIRAHAQVIQAAARFQQVGCGIEEELESSPDCSYGIAQEKLGAMSKDHNSSTLLKLGGVNGLAEKLRTNLEKGLPENDDLEQRKAFFGSNTYPQSKGHSFWRFLWEACQDWTILFLMLAALALIPLGIISEGRKEGWYAGGGILFAAILVIIATAISDYVQYLQYHKLNKENRRLCSEVIRGGKRVKLPNSDIVVGDVVPLKVGDQICADGVLISGHSLAIDESRVTGESKIAAKDFNAPFLLSGCIVADGYGTMLVINVGIGSEWGLLMASISGENWEETPFQVRLNGLATFIGKAGLQIAVVVLIVLLARYFTGHMNASGTSVFKAGKTNVIHVMDEVIKIVTVAVTIVIVAVPDGLPLAVTLILACLARRMIRDKALVRRLSACETMGSATTICSVKTGTLTLNQMTVVEAYAYGKKLDPLNEGSSLTPVFGSLLREGIAQNTTGSVYASEGGGDAIVFGTPTEKAILSWGVKLGMNFAAERSRSKIIKAFAFNSVNKRGGVAVKADSEVRIHWKGAAEVILALCTRYIDENAHVASLDEQKLAFYKEAIEKMAAQSLRCIALAYQPYELNKELLDQEELDQWVLPVDNLIMLAIVGIKDPCRPGVRDSIALCKSARLKVRMVTGDNLMTAKAVALECGILASEANANEPHLIDGTSFRNMSNAERLDIVENISVMGNSSPTDKLLLVQALRKKGHVVAVTADKINDVPVLHEADIGLAMGIAGTQVTKESSDIIILDDDFASVLKIVRWGRSVYANIQKFTQFQLTVVVVALIINVTGALSTGDIPLNTVQLLWIYLMTYTLGAVALATEPPTDHLVLRRPVSKREPLITNVMWRNMLIQAVYQVLVLLVLNFEGVDILHLRHYSVERTDKVKNTVIFNAFILCQIFNEFNARRPDQLNIFEGIMRNHIFTASIGATLIVQIIIIEFLGKFASTVSLSWQLWLVCIFIGFISWPLAALGKLIPLSRALQRTIWMLFPLCAPCCAPDSRH